MDDFDILQDKLSPMFKQSTPETYHEHKNWKWIEENYPDDISEFELLISRYWGDKFGCIPSNILGHYCCLDAFHTVLLRKAATDLGYTDKAWNTFNANMRMGAWLNLSGVFIDKPLLDSMSEVGYWMVCYGKLNIIKLYLHLTGQDEEIEDLGIPELEKLFKWGLNPFDGKALMTHYYAPDKKDGFNYELMEKELGQDLAMEVVGTYTKYFSTLNIPAQKRSKNAFVAITNLMTKHWQYEPIDGGCSFTINGVPHRLNFPLGEVLKKYRTRNNLNRLNAFMSQMKINEPKTYLMEDGEPISVKKVIGFCDNIINTNAPDYKPMMIKLLADNYWSAILDRYLNPDDMEQHLIDGKHEWYDWDYPVKPEDLDKHRYIRDTSNLILGLGIIERAVTTESTYVKKDEDGKQVTVKRYKGTEADRTELLECLHKVSNTYSPLRFYWEHKAIIKNIDYTGLEIHVPPYEKAVSPAKFLSHSFDSVAPGETIDAAFFRSLGPRSYYGVPKLKDMLVDTFDNIDVTENSLRGLTKFTLCYRMSRKYFKSLGTYINGMLEDGLRFTDDYDDNAFCVERWDHKDKADKKIGHIYPGFNVAEKKSGRWSSGFHTLPK